ncbi:MAG TPA: glycosyltransferase family 4 protein [Candidatus Saccharimonadales bacterium]|jgi:glycosyltransferase involved in cell wall biosynthesis|nr:glycosyltransferase family 4 protein [Candidatus Saccharimonadales bacterium]
MTVLLVSGDFTTWGGMDRANYELAWYLAEETDVQVHLVAYHVAEPLASHPNVVWSRVHKPLNSYALAAPLLARHGRAAARSIQARGGFTIVNGGNCAWPDINWIHLVHAAWEGRVEQSSWLAHIRQWPCRSADLRAESRSLRMARVMVANSEQTRVKVIENLDISPGRVRTIYFGTDTRVFHPATPAEKLMARARLGWPANVLTASFVGSFGYDGRKGFDILFAAWQQLCSDASWDVDLVAVGGGSDAARWQSEAERLGLSKRIRMPGFTKNIAEILHATDVLVHPAFYEPYGLSAHEALCCGIPVLVTRSAGVAERYPTALSDLLLNDPPSIPDLVQRLRMWRAQTAAYRSRSEAFGSTLRQRTWKDMASDFVEFTMPSLRKTERNEIMA